MFHMVDAKFAERILQSGKAGRQSGDMTTDLTVQGARLRCPITLLLMASAAFAGSARGEEGMWLVDQAAAYGQGEEESGARPAEFPFVAVAKLGSCTASFVSGAGLLLTNHHCLSGSVQSNSSPEHDYLTEGFVAMMRGDELRAASGTRINVIEAWREITGELSAGTAGLGAAARERLMERRRKAFVAECEARPHRRCQIYSYWGGTREYLEQRFELQDIRLAYAPASGLADFGGDRDNWDWPRHTGDFGLYRAYVAPDGSPASYSAQNIPYSPPAVLKIAREGVSEGDAVWTAGFPVVTNRLATAAETAFNLAQYEPQWLALLTDYETQILAATAGDREKELRYAPILDNTRNYRKKLTGSLLGADAGRVAERKQADEDAFLAWVDDDAKRRKMFMPHIAELDSAAAAAGEAQLNDLQRSLLERGQLLQAARTLYRWAKEREKPDADRATGFRDRDRQLVADRLRRIQSRFVASVDRTLLEAGAAEYSKLPAAEKSTAFEERLKAIGFDRLYSSTKLESLDERLAWLDQSAAAFEQSGDPFIQLAVAIYPDDAARAQNSRARASRVEGHRNLYLAALAAYRASTGRPAYPDADGTLRVSKGRVEGRVRDGETWTPFTSTAGLLEKHSGQGEFNAPLRLVKAIRTRDFGRFSGQNRDRLPVNFLSSADITSGNSGSPTLNAKGEVVGLVFDGTMDGVISDWVHVADRNRTIHVDIRFLLWVMEKVDGAGHLVEEMSPPR